MYTVKQIAELANISVRTLHHYDDIGLLRPTKVGANGYRYYDDSALIRLQQILLYKEMDMELMQIKEILDNPNFDPIQALHAHRKALMHRAERLADLINTVESTIVHLGGGKPMSNKKMFGGFSDEQQKDYEREIRLEYGPDKVNESVKRWKNYSEAQKQAIMDEGNAIYTAIVSAIEAKTPADSIDDLMRRWHQHIRYFYEPTLEILRGLGDMYTTHPDFITNFKAMHPDLGEYMKVAINHYVDELEYAEIARMLAEDERLRGNE
jgi:DNA-binding transcriptional MerR regulator